MKRWLKAEGDSFNAGDCLCEISFSSISIGYEIEHAGILAKVLVHDGQLVEVDTPIAVYASNQDDYMSYIESKRVEAIAAEMFQQTKEEKPQKPDKMVLLREIKHLIQNGHIEDGSGKHSFHLFTVFNRVFLTVLMFIL